MEKRHAHRHTDARETNETSTTLCEQARLYEIQRHDGARTGGGGPVQRPSTVLEHALDER